MDARSFYGKKLVPVPAGDISDDDRLSDEDDPCCGHTTEIMVNIKD